MSNLLETLLEYVRPIYFSFKLWEMGMQILWISYMHTYFL
jgi:hypothetical protein